MTAADLQRRLRALAAGALKGRHVLGVSEAVQLGQLLPQQLRVARLDAEALLLEQDWPPAGTRERGLAVARRLGQALSDRSAAANTPLLLVVERADPLIGEASALTPVFDLAIDDRMIVFLCSAPCRAEDATVGDAPALVNLPPNLSYRAGAALRRLAEFKLEIVEA